MEKENEKSEEKKLISNEEQENVIKETEEYEQNINTQQNIEINKEVEKEETNKIHEEEVKEKIVENIKPKEETKVTQKVEHSKEKVKKSKKILIVIFFLIMFILLIFLSTIFAIININNEKTIQGIYIEQVNIGDMTQDEINELVNNKTSAISEISINNGEYNDIIKLEDLGIEIDAKEAIQKSISIGKTGNIVIDNYQILKANLFEEHFEMNIYINQEKFEKIAKNIQAEIPEGIKEYSYEIKDDELIITNGKAGKKVNTEELKNKIIENIKEQFNGTEEILDIPVQYSEPQNIDIEKIYNEIYKEAKDAYIVEEPFELHKEENGINFKITIEEAKQILAEEKETYIIPLKITKPKVAVKDLGDKLFKQTLSKYTTIYDAGNYNRSHNIALAAKTINGTILLPGETFSYNGILGNTNKAKGYKVGTAYVGGKVVESYGGGICQVSSTLYNAVLYANLEIVERYNHSYAVNYVPAGRDATVAYGGKDFKFKNTRAYPIKIVSSAKNGVVSISIAGIKEDMDKYEIVLTSTVLSTTQNTTVYENNSSLEEGKEKVIQKGYIGKKSIAYKIVKNPDGTTKSKTVLSKDTYKPMNRIVQVGTKKVVTESSTTTQTSTPSTTPATSTNTTQVQIPTVSPTPSTSTTTVTVNNTTI